MCAADNDGYESEKETEGEREREREKRKTDRQINAQTDLFVSVCVNFFHFLDLRNNP